MPSPSRNTALSPATAALLVSVIVLSTVALWNPIASAAPGDPNVTMASPAANQTIIAAPVVTLRAQATDDVGIARGSMAIRRSDTGQYLRSNGTWASGLVWLTASVASLGATSTALTYDWTSPAVGRYSVTAQVWDSGNRSDATRPTVNFTVALTIPDTARPNSSVASPTSGQVFTSVAVAMGGSANDNVGVRTVEFAIRDRATNLYWRADGTWGSLSWFATTLALPDATSTGWTGAWTAPRSGDFALGTRARDAAGNTSTTSWRNFTVAIPGQCPPTTLPYGLGTLELDLTDASRGRSFETTVYYPSARGTSGASAPAACGPFPMVVLGHGGSGTGESAAQLHRFLAQAGYVVVGPTFPAGFQYEELTQDVSFVIDEMLARSAGGQGPLVGLINDRIGFIGTSKGGMIGLALYQACCGDPRIDAVVSKIGVAPTGTYDWPAGPPLLMINGTADTTAPYATACRTTLMRLHPRASSTCRASTHPERRHQPHPPGSASGLLRVLPARSGGGRTLWGADRGQQTRDRDAAGRTARPGRFDRRPAEVRVTRRR